MLIEFIIHIYEAAQYIYLEYGTCRRRSCLLDFLARRRAFGCSAEFSYSHMRFAHNCA